MSDWFKNFVEGDNWFWRVTLRHVNKFSTVVMVFFWLAATLRFTQGRYLLAGMFFLFGALQFWAMWFGHRNRQIYRQWLMEIHAMEEIERPDPS